jgi:hypothetical protein
MKLRHAAALALAGAANAAGAFFIGISATGLKAVPMPWAIITFFAYWPNFAAAAVLPENAFNSLSEFFDRFPLLYVLAMPIVGWILLGLLVEKLWTQRRRLVRAR